MTFSTDSAGATRPSHPPHPQARLPRGSELTLVGRYKHLSPPHFRGSHMQGIGGTNRRCFDCPDRLRDHLGGQIDDRCVANIVEQVALKQREVSGCDSFLAQAPHQRRENLRHADDSEPEVSRFKTESLNGIAARFLEEAFGKRRGIKKRLHAPAPQELPQTGRRPV